MYLYTKKNIEPQYRVAQYREEKTEVLQTGAYISATKKTKIHTYYGLDHDYKEKTKQKTTYCFIFCINFEFNYYDLYTLPVTFLLYNLYIFRVHFRLIYQHGYLNKSSSFGTDQNVSYHFFMSLTQIIKLAVQNGKFCIYVHCTRLNLYQKNTFPSGISNQ